MKPLAIAIFISALAPQCAALAQAQGTGLPRWQQRELEKEMDAYVRAEIKQARANCARKFGIASLPDNTIDLVVRYGSDKANAFTDCVIHETHVDWHQ